MSEDDDFDDLPSISVNTSRTEDVFMMPPADVLAAQRAREASLEREASLPLQGESGTTGTSDTEDEEALAVQVRDLLVTERPARRSRLSAREVLDVLSHPQPSLLAQFVYVAEQLPSSSAEALVHEVVEAAADLVLHEETWTDEEVLNVGLFLCAALVWAAPAVPRLRVARLLHTLLDERCTPIQVDALGASWGAVGAVVDPQLEVCAAAVGASGPAGGAARFADKLLASALADALHLQQPINTENVLEATGSTWRSMAAHAQVAAVRLLALAIARGWFAKGGAARILEALELRARSNTLAAHKNRLLMVIAQLRCLHGGAAHGEAAEESHA